jgi:eukaryotic-like serine/threonine-protein kinase
MATVASGRSACPQCRAVFRGGFQRCPHDGTPLSTEDRDPLVGSVLADRYLVESVIGEGGIGRVYRARHVRMSRRYAIKVPFGELAYDPKVRQRFLHEAEATSRLSHPNVIGVVDVGETPAGLLYMAMDLAEGVSLAQVVMEEGPLARGRVLRIVEQMAAGLGHAHARGLVHRDLKPENVILEREPDGSDRVRIVDFGIAILRDAEGHSGRLTTEGIVLGTPHYMSPEQACNLPIDHRTDLFALGLITYEMLAGVLPFDGTPVEVARKNLGADAPRITTRVPGLVVDHYLQALAFWLMKKKPEERPQSADEIVEVVRLIERDPIEAAKRLHLGELEEVEMGVAPVADTNLPAPKGMIRPRAPLPAKQSKSAKLVPAEAVVAEGTEAAAPSLPPVAQRLRDDDLEPVYTTERQGKRRGFWIVLAALLLAFGAVVAILTTRSPEPAREAAAPSVDAAVVVRAAPDATVVVAVAPDAAVPDAQVTVAELPIDAGVKKSGNGGRKPKIDAGVATAPPPRIDAGTKIVEPPAGDEPPSTASLSALYKQVGRQLNALVATKGEEAALAFKKRYGDIPYLEAIRKPALRAEAMAKLRSLSKEIDRAN